MCSRPPPCASPPSFPPPPFTPCPKAGSSIGNHGPTFYSPLENPVSCRPNLHGVHAHPCPAGLSAYSAPSGCGRRVAAAARFAAGGWSRSLSASMMLECRCSRGSQASRHSASSAVWMDNRWNSQPLGQRQVQSACPCPLAYALEAWGVCGSKARLMLAGPLSSTCCMHYHTVTCILDNYSAPETPTPFVSLVAS